jgi:hypothetical protein
MPNEVVVVDDVVDDYDERLVFSFSFSLRIMMMQLLLSFLMSQLIRQL